MGESTEAPDKPLGGRRICSGYGLLLALTVLVGSGLRIRQWWWDRSLWGDEANVVVQVLDRGYGGLTHQLDGYQAAPVGWLWAEKTSSIVFGDGERSMRLFPLLCGIAGLTLMAILVRRLLTPVAGIIAMVLMIATEPVSYYANEAKPYATDVTATLAIVLITLRMQRSPTVRALVAWALVITVSLQLSYPAVFPAAACTLSGLVFVVWKHRESLVGYLIAAVSWGLLFAVDYIAVIHKNNNSVLDNYWNFAYAPQPLRASTLAPWTEKTFLALAANPLGLASAGFVLAITGVGLCRLLVQRLEIGLPILITILGAYAAAVLGVYPLAQRCSLFLAPLAFIGLAALALPVGLGAATSRSSQWSVYGRPPVSIAVVSLGAALALGVLARPVQATVEDIGTPTTHQETREAMDYIDAHRQPGDVVFVNVYVLGVVTMYYDRFRKFPVVGGLNLTPGCDEAANLRQLLGYHRIWFITGVPGMVNDIDTPDREFAHLARIGQLSQQRDIPAVPPAGILPTQVGAALITVNENGVLGPVTPDGLCMQIYPLPPPAP